MCQLDSCLKIKQKVWLYFTVFVSVLFICRKSTFTKVGNGYPATTQEEQPYKVNSFFSPLGEARLPSISGVG